MSDKVQWQLIQLPVSYLYFLSVFSLIHNNNDYMILPLLYVVFGGGSNVVLKKLVERCFDGKQWILRPMDRIPGYKKTSFGPTLTPGVYNNSSGFPSGHAQSMALFTSFYNTWHRRNFSHTPNLKLICLCILCSMVMYQRYYSKCHSVSQLIFGASLGTMNSKLAYRICHSMYPDTFK